MRIIPCLLLLAGFLLVADSCRRTIQTPVCEPGAVAGPGELVPEGFVPLFNGINLDGWKVRQSQNRDWQVVEGNETRWIRIPVNCFKIRTGKEIRFRFWLSEDKAGKEAKRRPTGW